MATLSVSSNQIDASAEDLWTSHDCAVGGGDANKALEIRLPAGAFALTLSFITNAGEVAYSATLGSPMAGHPQDAGNIVTWELPQEPGDVPSLFIEVGSATTVIFSVLGRRG